MTRARLVLNSMSQFAQIRPHRRAPRINLRGTIPVTIQLENARQLSARLHQLSVTGGLLELATYIEERTWVGLRIPLSAAAVHPTAEMLFPMRGGLGYLQPFRIVRLRVEESRTLEKEVLELLQQTLAPSGLGRSPGANPPRYLLET